MEDDTRFDRVSSWTPGIPGDGVSMSVRSLPTVLLQVLPEKNLGTLLWCPERGPRGLRSSPSLLDLYSVVVAVIVVVVVRVVAVVLVVVGRVGVRASVRIFRVCRGAFLCSFVSLSRCPPFLPFAMTRVGTSFQAKLDCFFSLRTRLRFFGLVLCH